MNRYMADFSILSFDGVQRMGLPLNSCYLLTAVLIMTSAARRYILRGSANDLEMIIMTTLLSGLGLFFGVHTIPMLPRFKASLQSRIGALPFKGIYSLISLTGFILILLGMSRAEFRPVFVPPAWSPLLANLAMPVSFCLLVAAYVPNNFRRVIHNPMLSGILVWALSHLLANGDLASILLFGLFGTYAVIDMISVNRRSPAEIPARQPLIRDVLVIIIGFSAFWAVRYFHAALFGVPVVV